MSIMMTLEVTGEPDAVEQFASDNKDTMEGIVEAAKRHGLIAHRFFGSHDGSKILVADEWLTDRVSNPSSKNSSRRSDRYSRQPA